MVWVIKNNSFYIDTVTDSQSLQQPSPPDAWQATPTGAIHGGHARLATGAGTQQAKGGDLNEHRQPCPRWQDATGLRRGNVGPLTQWTLGCRRLCAGLEIGPVDGAVTFAMRMGQTANSVFALTADGSARGDEVGGHEWFLGLTSRG